MEPLEHNSEFPRPRMDGNCRSRLPHLAHVQKLKVNYEMCANAQEEAWKRLTRVRFYAPPGGLAYASETYPTHLTIVMASLRRPCVTHARIRLYNRGLPTQARFRLRLELFPPH
jgi:hypothetical protein